MAGTIEIPELVVDNAPVFEWRRDRVVAVFTNGVEMSIDADGGLAIRAGQSGLSDVLVGPDVLAPLIADAVARGLLKVPTDPDLARLLADHADAVDARKYMPHPCFALRDWTRQGPKP